MSDELVEGTLRLLREEPEVLPPIAHRSKTRLVSCNDTEARLAQAMRWKHSWCPSCGTMDGWRIGSKWCLKCVEWRPLPKKRRTRKTERE